MLLSRNKGGDTPVPFTAKRQPQRDGIVVATTKTLTFHDPQPTRKGGCRSPAKRTKCAPHRTVRRHDSRNGSTLPEMRVVAGSARGRKLVAPPGLDVRPTLDRVRQAIFNSLEARGAVEDARVVDLFAGTGALGIEALSRGAAHVTFVENNRHSLVCLKENIDSLGFTAQATIVRSDVNAWSTWRIPEMDLLLIDPPYTYPGWDLLLERVLTGLARPEGTDQDLRGIAVLETPRPIALPATWEVVREQKYGGTVVTFAIPATSLSNTPHTSDTPHTFDNFVDSDADTETD